MKYAENGQALAKEMGIPASKLKETLAAYNTVAREKKCPFGKKFFHNVPFEFNDNFWVAIITPVIHYCMGGLQITPEAEVVTKQGKVIPGLFAAGEVTGGVHGNNRLGGSSLQDCVVFGRVSGGAAARYLMNQALTAIAERRLGAVGKQLFGGPDSGAGMHANLSVDTKSNTLTITVSPVSSVGGAGASTSQSKAAAPAQSKSAASAAPATKAAPAAAAKPAQKEYTLDEVAKHKTEKDCWVVVNGQVLDVTSFLKDHPGGKQAILLYAGKDATAEFNMLHKPDVVGKYAPHTIIGTLKGGSKPAKH